MQIFLKKTLAFFTLAVVIVYFICLNSLVSAQFGRDTYGSCEYGVSCPVDPDESDTQDPPGDDDGDQENEDNQGEDNDLDNENDSSDSENEGENGNGSGNNRGSNQGLNSGSASSTIVKPKSVLSSIVEPLISPIEFVRKLPVDQQAVLPYYSWILLIILAAILLMQSYYDHHTAKVLKKEVDDLHVAINEERTFMHLALHYLNTPFSTLKSSLELLSTNTDDSEAKKYLAPYVDRFGELVKKITMQLDETKLTDAESIAADKAKSYTSRTERLYYILPVAVALIFGVLLTYLLYSADSIQPAHKFHYQLGVAVLSSFIFLNAVRFYRIGRMQKLVFKKTKELAIDVREQRKNVVHGLSENLDSIVINLLSNAERIKTASYKKIFINGIKSVSRISNRAKLTVSRLDSDVSVFEINKFLTAAIGFYQPQITEKNLHITTDYKGPDSIYAFRADVEFVLESVIENAITYTHDEGSINIATYIKNKTLHITVSDSGPGMSQEELAKVFTPFYQKDDVLKFDHGGASLSLFAANKAVERLGGGITINSSVQKGTSVEIAMPVNY